MHVIARISVHNLQNKHPPASILQKDWSKNMIKPGGKLLLRIMLSAVWFSLKGKQPISVHAERLVHR